MSFALLDDLLLYFRDSPAAESMVGERIRSVLPDQLTFSAELSHRIRTYWDCPLSFHSFPGPGPGGRQHKITRARHNLLR